MPTIGFSSALNNFYFNQSVKIDIASLQDSYSEALLTQAKRKRTALRRWWKCLSRVRWVDYVYVYKTDLIGRFILTFHVLYFYF